MKPFLSTAVKLTRSILATIAYLSTFALPATIALGFFVAWIAFGPLALLSLVPFLALQKPKPEYAQRTVHILMVLLTVGLATAYAISLLYTDGQIQELAQSIAKLRSVRSGIADSAAAGDSAYQAHVFLGEALGGLIMTALAFYFLTKPGRYHDMLALTDDTPRSMGWGRSVFWFAYMVAITCFFARALLDTQATYPANAITSAGLMATISFGWLQQATGIIRILPRLLPDVEARK